MHLGEGEVFLKAKNNVCLEKIKGLFHHNVNLPNNNHCSVTDEPGRLLRQHTCQNTVWCQHDDRYSTCNKVFLQNVIIERGIYGNGKTRQPKLFLTLKVTMPLWTYSADSLTI